MFCVFNPGFFGKKASRSVLAEHQNKQLTQPVPFSLTLAPIQEPPESPFLVHFLFKTSLKITLLVLPNIWLSDIANIDTRDLWCYIQHFKQNCHCLLLLIELWLTTALLTVEEVPQTETTTTTTTETMETMATETTGLGNTRTTTVPDTTGLPLMEEAEAKTAHLKLWRKNLSSMSKPLCLVDRT